jgi:hypothetical protein
VRRRVPILLAGACLALTACGSSSSSGGIVFDATTPAGSTTPPIQALETTTTLTASTTSSVEVSAEPPGPGISPGIPTTSPIADDEPSIEPGPGEAVVGADPTTTRPAPAGSACAEAGCSGPQIVPFPTLTEVSQLGEDPVRGSGCGLSDEFGTSMPDGLYFGLLYPEGDETSFDVICVYYGESALDQGADDGPESDFFPVNGATRQREVPLAGGFVYRVGSWTPDGQCVDAGPVGNADWNAADDGTAAWLTIIGGDATGAVAMCPL